MGFSWKALMGWGDNLDEGAEVAGKILRGNTIKSGQMLGYSDDVWSNAGDLQKNIPYNAPAEPMPFVPGFGDDMFAGPYMGNNKYRQLSPLPEESGGVNLLSNRGAASPVPVSAPSGGLPGFPGPLAVPTPPTAKTAPSWATPTTMLTGGGVALGAGALGTGAYLYGDNVADRVNTGHPFDRDWFPESQPVATQHSYNRDGEMPIEPRGPFYNRDGGFVKPSLSRDGDNAPRGPQLQAPRPLAPDSKPAANPNFEEAAKSLTIKEGATLWEIAKGKPEVIKAIMDANPQITDPDKIYAGASMKLPTMHQYNLDNFLESM